MKKSLLKILVLFGVFIACMTCSIKLNKLDRKTVRKCQKCKDFLKKYERFEAPYQLYDRSIPRGSVEPDFEELQKSLTNKKACIFLLEDYQQLSDHQFCFNGMKKSEIENRFGRGFPKNTGYYASEWSTTYHPIIGTFENGIDSLMVIDYSILFAFYYEVIDRDTFYKPTANDYFLLKQCLDTEGVKYIDNLEN